MQILMQNHDQINQFSDFCNDMVGHLFIERSFQHIWQTRDVNVRMRVNFTFPDIKYSFGASKISDC